MPEIFVVVSCCIWLFVVVLFFLFWGGYVTCCLLGFKIQLQPPPKMKKSTSQTSLKSVAQDKTGTTRSAVSATLRRQTTTSTTRRGPTSTQARPAAGQLFSVTKRQTIASKPPASTARNVQSKAPTSEPFSGLKGNFLNFTNCVFCTQKGTKWTRL